MSKNYMNDSQASEIMKYISDTMKLPLIGAGGGFAPLGMYGFSCDYVLTPPQGWLFADGSIYNIADYPEYAALLASQHGRANIYGGDGVTTFATKDLRGEFIRGWGQNSHENQGDGGEVGEHQDGTEFSIIDRWNGGAGVTNPSYLNEDIIKAKTGSFNYQQLTRNEEGGLTNERMFISSHPTNTSVAFLVKVTVSGDANAHQYSTEEQIVGTWVDGKPIYEKTIIFPSNSGDSGSLESYNIDKFLGIDSCGTYIRRTNGQIMNIAYVNNDSLAYGISFLYDNGHLYASTRQYEIRQVVATIRYTKTQ